MRRGILNSETKGNIPIYQTQDGLKDLPNEAFSESTKKLIELEYGYAKDNAVLAISQRSAMMQVYVAALGIAVTVLLAAGKTYDSFFANSPLFIGLGAFGAVVSAYMMRGMIFLRSDWCDYINSMAKAKIFLIRMEVKELRIAVLNDCLYHDPFHPPSRNLRTNFFYISFLFCTVILFYCLALIALLLAADYSFVTRIRNHEQLASLLVSSGFALMFIAVVTANVTWRACLRTKRSMAHVSPSFR